MSEHASLYDVYRRHKPRKRLPMATLRERFMVGVPLGFVWWTPVTRAVWLVHRPASLMRAPGAVN